MDTNLTHRKLHGLHGYMVTWLHGYMVTWLHRYIVTSLHGYIVKSSHRYLGTQQVGPALREEWQKIFFEPEFFFLNQDGSRAIVVLVKGAVLCRSRSLG